MTEQEQKAFDQMREALIAIQKTDLPLSTYANAGHESLEDAIQSAITAANAVSEQQWYPVEEMSEQIAELSLVIATNSFYQQGHKDGLEWAAQMVEYNDPRTGDWMWDDRNDLANVIRKGPELPDAVSHPQVTEPQAQGELVDKLFAVFQGWSGSTFGWQDSSDLKTAGDKFERAKKAHEDECKRRLLAVLAHPQATEPAGWKLVPVIPTEEQWGGLARDIMMWLDMDGRKSAGSLFKHLERCGAKIPQWLRDEPEMKNLDHVPSKGTRVTIIYRAMLAAAPEAHHGK